MFNEELSLRVVCLCEIMHSSRVPSATRARLDWTTMEPRAGHDGTPAAAC